MRRFIDTKKNLRNFQQRAKSLKIYLSRYKLLPKHHQILFSSTGLMTTKGDDSPPENVDATIMLYAINAPHYLWKQISPSIIITLMLAIKYFIQKLSPWKPQLPICDNLTQAQKHCVPSF